MNERIEDLASEVLLTIKGHKITVEMLVLAGIVLTLTYFLLLVVKSFMLSKRRVSAHERGRKLSFFKLISYFVWVLSISIVFQIFEVSITFLLAGSAALMVGIGLGLQNFFNDLISGLFLLFEHTVKVGDVLEVDGMMGKVEEISLRTSILVTPAGVHVIVPNSKFISNKVINWSLKSMDRGFTVNVGVHYDSDEEKVTSILLNAASEHPEVINNEQIKPSVRIVDFGNSSVDFQLLFWTENAFFVERIRSELRFAIFKAFRQEGVTIPYPQMDLYIKEQPKAN